MTDLTNLAHSGTRSFRDLIAWQRGVELAVECHSLARRLPADERHGLSSQLRRSSVSVPANIAEGNGRFSLREYLHHLSFANGSVNETESHLIIVERSHYLSASEIERALHLSSETGRLLLGLARSLRRKMSP